MKTLNLVRPDTSDIKFEVSHYPDGQQDIKILTPKLELGHYDEEYYWIAKPVTIKSRFNSFKDLEIIIAATKALKHLGSSRIDLYIPYLLGARSDRQVVDGGTSYLVDVVAPIINDQEYQKVITYDAHSDVAAACIHNLEVIDNKELVAFAFNDINKPLTEVVFVSPDGGSLKKIYKVADITGFQGDVVICSKFRDWEGKLSRVEVPIKDHQASQNFVIIDDLCDGGRTFTNIAKVIKERAGFSGKIYLIVTHGLFTHGYDELSRYFDNVYCTNSYKDLVYMRSEANPLIFKQLNVF